MLMMPLSFNAHQSSCRLSKSRPTSHNHIWWDPPLIDENIRFGRDVHSIPAHSPSTTEI
jgi:hypothetical protein